ncbi:DUF2946 family protein [Stutzerimonas marianensis]
MIQVGPLYSASRLSAAAVQATPNSMHQHHHDHGAQVHAPAAPAGSASWLASLERCGYCEWLTMSPALALVPPLSVFAADYVPSSSAEALPTAPRRSPAHPRAPPRFDC